MPTVLAHEKLVAMCQMSYSFIKDYSNSKIAFKIELGPFEPTLHYFQIISRMDW